jgi:transcriptional regulator with XRE-family HTH domain
MVNLWVLRDQKREAICSHVARILREERENRGISMATLARLAGLSQAMISFVEREIRNPSLDTLLRMAEALELNLGDVLLRAYTSAGTVRKE